LARMRDCFALRWFCVGIGEVAPTSGDGGSSQMTILKMSIVLGALGRFDLVLLKSNVF